MTDIGQFANVMLYIYFRFFFRVYIHFKTLIYLENKTFCSTLKAKVNYFKLFIVLNITLNLCLEL